MILVEVEGRELEVSDASLRISWREYVKELSLTVEGDPGGMLRTGAEVSAKWMDGTPLFSGIIHEVEAVLSGREEYRVLCRDHLTLLENIVVRASYPPLTPAHEIVLNIISLASQYGITGNGVQPAPRLLSETNFHNITALRALIQVAEATGYALSIDPWKDVKFHPRRFGRNILGDPSFEATRLQGDPWTPASP